MKQNRKEMLVVEIIAAIFVLLFLYTAIEKWREITKFEWTIRESALIGDYAKIVSWLAPTTEIAAVILLIFPRTRYAGLITSTILMIIFTGYIAVMLMTSSNLPCTCGGVIKKMTWKQHLVFNSAFLLLGATGIILNTKNSIIINRRSRMPV